MLKANAKAAKSKQRPISLVSPVNTTPVNTPRAPVLPVQPAQPVQPPVQPAQPVQPPHAASLSQTMKGLDLPKSEPKGKELFMTQDEINFVTNRHPDWRSFNKLIWKNRLTKDERSSLSADEIALRKRLHNKKNRFRAKMRDPEGYQKKQLEQLAKLKEKKRGVLVNKIKQEIVGGDPELVEEVSE